MLAHVCFFLALGVYYVAKVGFKKASLGIYLHVILGTVSILSMVMDTVMQIGSDRFWRYSGFSLTMLFIGISGYYVIKQGKRWMKWHIGGVLLRLFNGYYRFVAVSGALIISSTNG